MVRVRPLGGKIGNPEAAQEDTRELLDVTETARWLFRISSVIASPEVDPVGVRIDLGELAGVIGNVDIGSHILVCTGLIKRANLVNTFLV